PDAASSTQPEPGGFFSFSSVGLLTSVALISVSPPPRPWTSWRPEPPASLVSLLQPAFSSRSAPASKTARVLSMSAHLGQRKKLHIDLEHAPRLVAASRRRLPEPA